eukprot:6726024-Pyramimonas_sp.AAC.2
MVPNGRISRIYFAQDCHAVLMTPPTTQADCLFMVVHVYLVVTGSSPACVDPTVSSMASLKCFLRDHMAIWRSANDIIMTAGRKGIPPPTHIVQLIGILPNTNQCRYHRVGHAWVNPLYMWDNERRNRRDATLDDLCEIPNDASS